MTTILPHTGVQDAPLLSTKLYIPPIRPGLVRRPRLVQRLEAGLDLTLISAPAGFGKTTLLSEWARGRISERASQRDSETSASLVDPSAKGLPVAWLSLDEGDNDLARFLTYLAAALQTVHPGLKSVVSGWQSSPSVPAQAILTVLLNEIAAAPEPFVLALDDYHLIQAQEVHDSLAFVLEHQPPPLRLALATRADPPLPLARLRGQGRLMEIRVSDLKFAPGEIGKFFELALGTDLPLEAVATLGARTEGWALAVQLAGLVARGQKDVAGFVEAFDQHRYVFDYLAEQVFDRQPAHVRAFLLQTSILERLSGPLCDAVCQADDGQMMLERLVRENLFTIQLDETRAWFRYHHLFAEFLRARLQRDAAYPAAELHRRASQWFLEQRLFADAVQHAFAIPDFELAASIIEPVAHQFLARGEWYTLRRWLQALPDDLKRQQPEIAVWHAQVLLMDSQPQAAAPYLWQARPRLDELSQQGAINPKDHQAYSILIDVGLAYVAQASGDILAAMRLARRAQANLPPYRHVMHAVVARILSDCHLYANDTPEAARVLRQAIESDQVADDHYTRLNIVFQIGYLEALQGRLFQAASQYRSGLHDARQQGLEFLGAALLVGLADVLREQGQLPDAARLAQEGVQLSRSGHRLDVVLSGLVVLARTRQAQADLAGARECLAQAQGLVEAEGSPPRLAQYVLAQQASLAAATGDQAGAIRWAQTCGLDVEDDLDYEHEMQHIILARVLLALERLGQALSLLNRLYKLAQAGARTGRVIEILALQALAQRKRDDLPAALATLCRALALAEPQGFARVFLDTGPLMVELLRATPHQYAAKLLSASGPGQPLIEPLSQREREILTLIAAGLTNRAIASKLYLSFNTVIWHNKNIYRKLGVTSRTQAVARARELALLT